MKIHEILPAISIILTTITLVLTSFIRQRSVSTFSILLVLLTALVPASADLLVLRIHHIQNLETAFRAGFSGEFGASTAILLFSLVFSRKHPLAQIGTMGIPLTLIGLGVLFSIFNLFFEHNLFRVLIFSQNHSVLLISNPSLSTVSFFLIGILLLAFFQMAKTYMSAGSMERWNIKYPMIGVALWAFSLILVHANQLLNNGFDRSFLLLEHIGILLLDGFFLYAFLIQKTQEIALGLSRSVINRSVLILLGGAGLLILGGIGNSLAALGPSWGKLASSLTVLLGVGAFVVVFSSERLRRELEGFLGIHFYSNRYDYRAIWMTLTQAISESEKPEDLVSTLMEQTREITLAHTLSYAPLTEIPSSILTIEETLGWKTPWDKRKHSFPAAWNRAFENGLPVHDSDLMDRTGTFPGDPPFDSLFKILNANWVLPLVFQSRVIGLLGLGIRGQGSRTLFEDRLFLQALAVQWVSILIYSSLSREMADKRETELLSSLRAFTFHDLKNAGVSLKLLVHNAKQNIESPEFQKELLFCLQNISEQIDTSMDQLLSPFRQEYTRLSDFDPGDLIEKTVRSLKWDDLPELKIRIIKGELPKAHGNSRAVETTLRNLLINAREALEDNGMINIETRLNKTTLTLSVSDNGPGMSREFIETRLFRPFQTTKKKGTGLGLFSCKLLIEQSGGTIEVNSREGEGTEFLITLIRSPEP
ncbi:MAG: ATP-binding protein [Leptospirales bacterium]